MEVYGKTITGLGPKACDIMKERNSVSAIVEFIDLALNAMYFSCFSRNLKKSQL